MAFRDDHDALRAKADALREQLESARRELRAHEIEDEQDEEELAYLRAQLARSKSPRRFWTSWRTVALSLAVVGAFSVYMWWLVTDVPPALSERGASSSVNPTEPPAPPAPLYGRDAVSFGAVVAMSQGEGPAVGDGCVLDAELIAHGRVGRVRLACRDVVYDSMERGEREALAWDTGYREVVIAPSHFVYALRYFDTGRRTGPRPVIRVDTDADELRVTRAADAGHPFDAVLHVEPWSTARSGQPLRRGSDDTSMSAEERRDAQARGIALAGQCDLDGAWRGLVRTAYGDLDGLSLAPSSTRALTVIRHGRPPQDYEMDADPVLTSPLGAAGAAALDFTRGDGTAVVTAGDQRLDGRFGPGCATFLGVVLGQPAPTTFFMRRLSDAERGLDVDDPAGERGPRAP